MSAWPVSPRVRALIREGAERALNPPVAWRDEVDEAVFAGPEMQRVVEDPELAAAVRRVMVSTLTTWVTANLHAPGDPVPADNSEASMTMARDLVRRGLDHTLLDSYRVGQAVAWRHWMEIAFDLTADPVELRELLDLTSRSVGLFVDASVDQARAHIHAERDQLTRDAQAERRAVVALIVQGAPITPSRAQARLGYRLDRTHHAGVVWSDAAEPDLGAIDRVIDALGRESTAAGTLVVQASTGTRWVWTTAAPQRGAALEALRGAPDVRVALAGPGDGAVGFRRAHLDALSTQRLLSRIGTAKVRAVDSGAAKGEAVNGGAAKGWAVEVGAGGRLASWDEVALVSLASHDREAATRFVADTLGDLSGADPELRETVRAFIRHGCSVGAAASATYTHRNTFLRRLRKAQALLPGPLERVIEVGVALELEDWNLRGSP